MYNHKFLVVILSLFILTLPVIAQPEQIEQLQRKLLTPLSLDERSRINAEIGARHELVANFSAASEAYNEAFFFSRPKNHLLLIRVGFLQAELGNFEEALAIFRRLQPLTLNNYERNRALSLAFTIYGLSRNSVAGTNLLIAEASFIRNNANANLLYNIYRYHRWLGDVNNSMLMASRIQTNFPLSPEANLLFGLINNFPSPNNIFSN